MKKTKTITAQELKMKIENHEDFILVDVLTSKDYQKLHISGALNIPLEELETKANQWLNRNIDVIVYSAGPHCKGAELAQQKLSHMGFRTSMLEGGLETWEDLQYSIEGDANYKPKVIQSQPKGFTTAAPTHQKEPEPLETTEGEAPKPITKIKKAA